MDERIVLVIIFAVIIAGILIIFFGVDIPISPPPTEEWTVTRTINNLDKRMVYTYFHEEAYSENFTLPFSEYYKVCFFNSSNPSQTTTWNPDETIKSMISKEGYNVWYYKGENITAGKGIYIQYFNIPSENNFCIAGGSKIYLINKGFAVEIHS